MRTGPRVRVKNASNTHGPRPLHPPPVGTCHKTLPGGPLFYERCSMRALSIEEGSIPGGL